MSTTFDDLIRQPKQRVKKSRGGVVAEVPEWKETSPFVGVVMEGLRRRFATKPSIEKELKVVKGRRTTFEDLLQARAHGYHAVRSDADFPDDWTGSDSPDLDATVSEFLAFLDGLE